MLYHIICVSIVFCTHFLHLKNIPGTCPKFTTDRMYGSDSFVWLYMCMYIHKCIYIYICLHALVTGTALPKYYPPAPSVLVCIVMAPDFCSVVGRGIT